MAQYDGGYPVDELMKYEEEYFKYVKEVRGIDLTYYGNWQRDFAKVMIEMADLGSVVGKEWVSLLDVGCATALNIRAYDELSVFKEIYGTDISSYMINTVIPDMYKDHEWNAGKVDFFATPSHDLSMIPDGSIDFITCTHVLEHLQSEEKLHETLEEFKRVLHPEGKILIIIPTKTKDYDPADAVVHVLNESSLWWQRNFNKYFKSESAAARKLYKATDLKPSRNGEDTFYDAYNHVWTIFRLVHKK
jgi:ubiquinone/menaquinone biosynthesis C-methylase UbiE